MLRMSHFIEKKLMDQTNIPAASEKGEYGFKEYMKQLNIKESSIFKSTHQNSIDTHKIS